jgi:hypothetical protein
MGPRHLQPRGQGIYIHGCSCQHFHNATSGIAVRVVAALAPCKLHKEIGSILFLVAPYMSAIAMRAAVALTPCKLRKEIRSIQFLVLHKEQRHSQARGQGIYRHCCCCQHFHNATLGIAVRAVLALAPCMLNK